MQRSGFVTACILLVGSAVADTPRSRSQFERVRGVIPSLKAETDKESAQRPNGFITLRRDRPNPADWVLSETQLFDQLGRSSWGLSYRQDPDPFAISPRWHHSVITELVNRSRRDDATRARIVSKLAAVLNESSESTASSKERRLHAAVALALLQDDAGAALLDEVFADKSAGDEKRTAAIFALAQLPHRLDARTLRRRLSAMYADKKPTRDRFGFLQRGSPPTTGQRLDFIESPALVAGVFLALVRTELERPGYDPTADRHVQQLGGFGAATQRRIAATAFAGRAWHRLPPLLTKLLSDSDDKVRRTALFALAQHPTEPAHNAVLRATGDLDVRLAAIDLLAEFPSDESLRVLDDLYASASSAVRAAAVRTAGKLDAARIVLDAVSDESYRVRAAAAEALATSTSEDANSNLAKLLADRSTQVQEAAAAAAARRPKAAAVPLLLDALESPSLRARAASIKGLAEVLPQATAFPVQADGAVRDREILNLRKLWRTAAPSKASRSANRVERQRLINAHFDAAPGLLAEWYGPNRGRRPAIVRRLLGMGKPVVNVVEEYLAARETFPGPELIRLVLAKLDPTYAAIARLQQGRSASTRSVNDLLDVIKHRAPTTIQARVLTEHAKRSTAETIWLRLVPILETDFAAMTAELDAFGMAHPSARVRQASCQRLGRRGGPRNAVLLAQAFNDPDRSVRLTALRSAGQSKDSALIEPLAEALRTRDAYARLAAATSLAQLGDFENKGVRELVRLLDYPDPEIRRNVVESLAGAGKSTDGLVLGSIVRALDDRDRSVRRAAVAGLETVTGFSHAQSKRGQSISVAEQVVRWKRSLEAGMRETRLAN